MWHIVLPRSLEERGGCGILCSLGAWEEKRMWHIVLSKSLGERKENVAHGAP